MENTRELVLDMLLEILEEGSYSHLVIRDVLAKYNYSDPRDKAFVKRVTEGTLERLIQIDYVLDSFSKVPVSRMKPFIRNLMRMSVYQILFMDSVPAHAACNEAVKLAGKRGFRGLSGFVNGVLRTIARNKQQIPYPEEEKDRKKYLSIRYSMPEWLVELWSSSYGEERTRKILEGLFIEHPVTVRVQERLNSKLKVDWLLALKMKGIEVLSHSYLPYAYLLKGTEGIENLPGYKEGFFTVQDVSSMLVAEVAAEQAKGVLGKLAVDVCASPGGKSIHLAEKMNNTGKVIARDISEYKVSLMRDNIERMGCKNIEVQVFDAAMLDAHLVGKADVVLADLPCSGLGIIGKKRDIKYRVSRESLQELVRVQKEILQVVWQYVKPGGVLIYSTCTINPGENEKMVEWFLQNHPFELEDLSPYLPEAIKEEGKVGMLQLFPGIHETDGFFMARLRRQ